MDHAGFTLRIFDIICNWKNVKLSGKSVIPPLETCTLLLCAVVHGWCVSC